MSHNKPEIAITGGGFQFNLGPTSGHAIDRHKLTKQGGVVLMHVPHRYTLATTGTTFIDVSFDSRKPIQVTGRASTAAASDPGGTLVVRFNRPLRFILHGFNDYIAEDCVFYGFRFVFLPDTNRWRAEFDLKPLSEHTRPKHVSWNFWNLLDHTTSFFQSVLFDSTPQIRRELQAFVAELLKGTIFEQPGFNPFSVALTQSAVKQAVEKPDIKRLAAEIADKFRNLSGVPIHALIGCQKKARVELSLAKEIREANASGTATIEAGTKIEIVADVHHAATEDDLTRFKVKRWTVIFTEAGRKKGYSGKGVHLRDPKQGTYIEVTRFTIVPPLTVEVGQEDFIIHTAGSGALAMAQGVDALITIAGYLTGHATNGRSGLGLTAFGAKNPLSTGGVQCEMSRAFTEVVRGIYFQNEKIIRQQLWWVEDLDQALGVPKEG